MNTVLVCLVFLPILSGALFLFLRSRVAKYSGMVISLAELCMAIGVFVFFRTHPFTDMGVNIPWIANKGINLELHIDGINILLVLLTGIAIPVIMLAGWDKNYHNYGLMDGMILILQGSLMGVYLSFNAFVYYIFWEMTLIPAYLILLLWGGEQRMRITIKFFIYTLAGSLFMLVALISLYLSTPGLHTFSYQALAGLSLDLNRQKWLFMALMVAFMIKTPVFPFHTWQPDTYTQAPSAGTMLLGGLMSKMGIFSMLRWLLPLVPLAVKAFAPWVIALAVFSLLYASVIALQEKNIKTLFAYSSIAHLSMAVAAIFTLTAIAIQGALILMFSHGIVIIGLFFVADIFKTRTDSQWLPDLGGYRTQAPLFGALYLIVLFASIGLPLTSGFPGELLMILGLAKYNLWLACLAGISFILGAVYMLVSYKSAMLGEPKAGEFSDLKARETIVFALLIGIIFFVGIFPDFLLKSTEIGVNQLVNLCIAR
jgi:NADH-quinone oxidoreductase subunit M